jgi:hypothetical protein
MIIGALELARERNRRTIQNDHRLSLFLLLPRCTWKKSKPLKTSIHDWCPQSIKSSVKGKRKICWRPRIFVLCQHKESGNLIGGRLSKGEAGYTRRSE